MPRYPGLKVPPLLAVMFALSGCISMDVPDEIEYSKTRSIYGMSCEKPFDLKIGCNSWNIANIDYGSDESRTRLSSTPDGKTLVVVNNQSREFTSSVTEGLSLFLVDISASDLGREVLEIIELLKSSGIEILDIQVISNVLDVWGYILITDGDALDALGVRPDENDEADSELQESDKSTGADA